MTAQSAGAGTPPTDTYRVYYDRPHAFPRPRRVLAGTFTDHLTATFFARTLAETGHRNVRIRLPDLPAPGE